MAGGGGNDATAAGTSTSDKYCSICKKIMDKRKLMRCSCPSHGGRACYTCLRKHYIAKPKTVYDFPFVCHHTECQYVLPNRWIQSFFAEGKRLGYDFRTESKRYWKLTRIARINQNVLGREWKSVLKNLKDMAKIMGFWCNISACKLGIGYAKCHHCQTIVLKDGGCDHMVCPFCHNEYSFAKCKLSIDEMEIGSVWIATKKKGCQRPKFRLAPVIEEITATGDADEMCDEDDDDDDHEEVVVDSTSEVCNGECCVFPTSGAYSWKCGDDYDQNTIIASDNSFQSWSVMSSSIQPGQSLSSFCVVSDVGSVHSLDDSHDVDSLVSSSEQSVSTFGSISCIESFASLNEYCNEVASDDGNGKEGLLSAPSLSYCDAAKQSSPGATPVKLPAPKICAASGQVVSKKKPRVVPFRHEELGHCGVPDDSKYDGRGGKRSLRYRGGKTRTGRCFWAANRRRGSQCSRKQRKGRKINDDPWRSKGRPGQRSGFRTTKSAAREYYGIAHY